MNMTLFMESRIKVRWSALTGLCDACARGERADEVERERERETHARRDHGTQAAIYLVKYHFTPPRLELLCYT